MSKLMLFIFILCTSELIAFQMKHSYNLRRMQTIDMSTEILDLPSIPSMDLASIDTLPYVGVSVGTFGLLKLGIYWRTQYLTASVISGIPKECSVVEIDAADGKNIYYLPKGTDYTAVMNPGNDQSKIKEKTRINEQLVLECIGKVNRDGLGLRGKVRTKTQEIPSKSADCVISTGALSRSLSPVETIQEVYRILRPGGLFVFVEPDGQEQVVKNILQIFPEKITGGISAGAKARKVQEKRLDSESESSLGSNKRSSGDKKKRNRKGFAARVEEQLNATNDISKNTHDSSNENVGTFASLGGTGAVEGQDDVSLGRTSSVEEGTFIVENSDDEPNRSAGDDKLKVRPGITWQRYQNLIDPYVTGIAVRP